MGMVLIARFIWPTVTVNYKGVDEVTLGHHSTVVLFVPHYILNHTNIVRTPLHTSSNTRVFTHEGTVKPPKISSEM